MAVGVYGSLLPIAIHQRPPRDVAAVQQPDLKGLMYEFTTHIDN